MKKRPATAPVIRVARIAEISALNPTLARSLFLSGTSAEIPPTNIAIEAKWAKPHRLYAVITAVLMEIAPVFMAVARS